MFVSCETREKRLKTAKKPASAFYFQLSGGSYNRNADQNELVTKQERLTRAHLAKRMNKGGMNKADGKPCKMRPNNK